MKIPAYVFAASLLVSIGVQAHADRWTDCQNRTNDFSFYHPKGLTVGLKLAPKFFERCMVGQATVQGPILEYNTVDLGGDQETTQVQSDGSAG